MRAYVGLTDLDWFNFLKNTSRLEELNFWQPGGNRKFSALTPGEFFLFKLLSPYDYIVGGGVFAHSSILPISLAWDSFGIKNGANSLMEMRKLVEKHRRQPESPATDYSD